MPGFIGDTRKFKICWALTEKLLFKLNWKELCSLGKLCDFTVEQLNVIFVTLVHTIAFQLRFRTSMVFKLAKYISFTNINVNHQHKTIKSD